MGASVTAVVSSLYETAHLTLSPVPVLDTRLEPRSHKEWYPNVDSSYNGVHVFVSHLSLYMYDQNSISGCSKAPWDLSV